MRILRMIYEWPPPWQGLAPAPYELTRSQIKLGHTFEIFSARWPRSGDLETLNKADFHQVMRAPLPGTVSLTSSPGIFFKYMSFRSRSRVDLVHSHGHFGLWMLWYRYFMEKYFPWTEEARPPLVAHFHNTVKGRKEKLLADGKKIKPVSRYLDWPLAEKADRLAIKSADAYIFVSEDLKKEAIKYYKAEPEKCFVVESGVNTEIFKYISPEEKVKTRLELKLNPTDKIILNVGAMVERKNILYLVEAMAHLPDYYKLMLVGNGDNDYDDLIDRTIVENQLKHRVVRVGYTPYLQIPIAYQSADLFVLPSVFEGLPKVVVEALACGVPALASGFTLKEDILGLEYLEETGPRFIAGRIKEMVENPRTVDRHKISQLYSWDAKAREVEQVYDHAKQTHHK